MKINDWYLGAMFIAAFWTVMVFALYAMAWSLGIPTVVVDAVVHILGMFMTMLALICLGMASATVVARDIQKQVNHA